MERQIMSRWLFTKDRLKKENSMVVKILRGTCVFVCAVNRKMFLTVKTCSSNLREVTFFLILYTTQR